MDGKKYIEVILPLKLEWNPVYYISGEENVSAGDRVKVRFAGREYVGTVSAVDIRPEVALEKISPVTSVQTGLPPVSAQEMEFWKFISEYYLCSIGEVYKAAYPSLKIRSEVSSVNASQRSEQSRARMTASIEKRIAKLKDRLEKKEAALEGRHSEAVKSRLEAERGKVASELEAARAALEKFIAGESSPSSCGKPARISSLRKTSSPALKPTVLTSPDRRNTYINMAREALAAGQNVLVLVPENDFASNMEGLFRNAFPGRLTVFSSRLSAAQRRKISDMLRMDVNPGIILGTRSSLFLPFRNLGLVIVDEEQDPLHKQTEPAPRINARDCAAVLAKIHGASLALGSSSPSLETALNCLSGKYAASRGAPLSKAEIIDVAAERRKNGMIGPYSLKLKKIIDSTEGRVVIVRGWENAEELSGWTNDLFGSRDVETLTPQAARKLALRPALMAILQADAIFAKDDFRADEKALQLMRQLSEKADRLVVQTAKSAHPVFRALEDGLDTAVLLEERKDFSLPPYTKMVDILIEDGSESRKELMTRRLCRALGTGSLRIVFPRDTRLAENKARLYRDILAFEKQNNYFSHIRLDVDPL